MLVQPEFSHKTNVKKAPKEMLRVDLLPDGRPHVFINYSSMDLINTCMRKANYSLNEQLVSQEESSATLFGSAIHKGLEVWYNVPAKERTEATIEAAIAGFDAVAKPLATLDLTDKRHPFNGHKLLKFYFNKFADDPYEVYVDKHGPIVERRVEFTLIDNAKMKVTYFGTIDLVLINKETNTVLVADHKTTAALGTEFYNRLKPNHQYTGYILGAKLDLGIDTNSFMINGLQVAKTKTECARQITTRNEEDFEELRVAVEYAVRNYLHARETNTWPQNAPNPCTMYGGCAYRSICEVGKALKQSVIDTMYRTKGEVA